MFIKIIENFTLNKAENLTEENKNRSAKTTKVESVTIRGVKVKKSISTSFGVPNINSKEIDNVPKKDFGVQTRRKRRMQMSLHSNCIPPSDGKTERKILQISLKCIYE